MAIPRIKTIPPLDPEIEVLCVGSDRVKTAASLLKRQTDRITVRIVSSPSAGQEVLETEGVDGIITEYELVEGTGTEFLEAVSETRPDGPIVLFADPVNEPAAGEVIAAGVTDYFRTEVDRVEYAELADRIERAVDRVRSRKRTADENRWLRTIVDACPILIAMLDEDGTVTYASQTCDTTLGGDPDAYVGKNAFDELVHISDRNRVLEEFQRLKGDASVDTISVEFRTQTPASTWKRTVATVSDRRDTLLDGYVMTARTIDRQSREHQQDLFAITQEISKVGTWEYDVVSDTLWWTEQVRNIQGLTTEEELSLSDVFDVYHPDDRPQIEAAFDRAIDEGDPLDEVFRLDVDGDDECWIRARGQPVLSDGEVVCLRGIYQDITDLKRREKQFESLHDASRDLMQASSRAEVAEITIDAAKNILGYIMGTVRLVDEDEAVLRTFAATEMGVAEAGERPDYRLDEPVPAARTFRTGEPEIYDDLTSVSDDYERGTLRSGLYLPIGDRGVFSCGETEPAAFDETDVELISVLAKLAAAALTRIQSEERLREQNERLEEFAGIIAHDLRNPLAVASGHLEILADSTPEELLEPIEASLERMETLIDDIFTLARQGEVVGTMTTVDVGAVAKNAWANVETNAARLVVMDAVPTVRGDVSRLEELFENLYRNAIDHVGADVTVTVGGLSDGFFVEDDGDGISGDEREAVLEAGYTTALDGTGYGLYIVNEIVRAHGWTMAVTSGADGGARFEITDVD